MPSFTHRIAASVIALNGVVGALQLHQPHATHVNQHYHENGWTPKPTAKPKPMIELFKRQDDFEFCGYLTGDGDQPVTCDFGSSCMYNEGYSWFGCCTGTEITDCEDVATACVRRNAIDECLSNSSCANDNLAIACTSDEYPSCAYLYTSVSGAFYGHYICDSISSSYEVVPTSSDLDDLTFTLVTESSSDESTSSRRTRSSQPVFSTTDESSTPTQTSSTQSTLTSTESEESSTTESEESSTTESGESSTTDASTTTAPSTSQGPAVAPPSSTTNAGALKTAEAVVGAVGGVVGMLAMLL